MLPNLKNMPIGYLPQSSYTLIPPLPLGIAPPLLNFVPVILNISYNLKTNQYFVTKLEKYAIGYLPQYSYTLIPPLPLGKAPPPLLNFVPVILKICYNLKTNQYFVAKLEKYANRVPSSVFIHTYSTLPSRKSTPHPF